VYADCGGILQLVRPFAALANRTSLLRCVDAEVHGDTSCAETWLRGISAGALAIVVSAPVTNRLAAERRLPRACRDAIGTPQRDLRLLGQLARDADASRGALESRRPDAIVAAARRLQATIAEVFDSSGSQSAVAAIETCPHS
jgi:cobyrinic acid a,c-diamide synthase